MGDDKARDARDFPIAIGAWLLPGAEIGSLCICQIDAGTDFADTRGLGRSDQAMILAANVERLLKPADLLFDKSCNDDPSRNGIVRSPTPARAAS
jgi:hypothetical protein